MRSVASELNTGHWRSTQRVVIRQVDRNQVRGLLWWSGKGGCFLFVLLITQ